LFVRYVLEFFFIVSFPRAAGDAVARFRPNVVVSGVEAFWEDSLLTEDEGIGARMLIGMQSNG
jgi:hypothetical protein